MFGKKEPPKVQPLKKQEQLQQPQLSPLPSNLPRANVTTWTQQWEYKWLQLAVAKYTDPSNVLAAMGAEGWELVAVYQSQIAILGLVREFYFKRPKVDQETP